MEGVKNASWPIFNNDSDVSVIELGRRKTEGSSRGFADAITVWINKPHVVNRRLCGSKILFNEVTSQSTVQGKWRFITNAVLDNDLERICVDAKPDGSGSHILSEDLLEVPSLADLQDGECMIVVRDLLPKNTNRNSTVREAVLYDVGNCTAWFCPILNIAQEELLPDDTTVGESDSVIRDSVLTTLPTDTDSEITTVSEKSLREVTRENPLTETKNHQANIISYEVECCADTRSRTGDNITESNNASYNLLYKREDGNSVIVLNVQKDESKCEEKSSQTFDWLRDHLLTKIVNWSGESHLKTTVTSLRLVAIDAYNSLYNELKEKYGKKFVQIWPEKTDPQKFVYEDVAIATYLLLLWQKERVEKNLQQKQSFVDLGCGNGLLVHILQSEGHPGLGLDVRRRNIWDLYGEQTVLQEQSVTPSADSLFPNHDWIIGNHSDELTPWIPVIASRSSYNCCYFVLPCCHFDFDKKFSQRGAGVSNYRAYLDFVKEVGDVCGFSVQEDTLRIPSTKRVCFIGSKRTYTADKEMEADKKRTDYIKYRCSGAELCKGGNSVSDPLMTEFNMVEQNGPSDAKRQKVCVGTNQWSANFQPRESIERSRNCKNVKKEIKDHIIHTVFTKLLQADTSVVRELPDGRKWRKGGSISLGEVVKLFDASILKELKSECGGLQTLLRNHNSVFNVSGGKVQLRDLTLDNPYSQKSKLSKSDKSQYFKTLLCWFYMNHPDGCPRTEKTCTFAHVALAV